MNIDKEIEFLKDNDLTIAIKIKNVLDHISDTVKQNGDMSQFKEDVMYVIHTLLEKQLNPKQLTACEIIFKRQGYEIQKAKENHLKNRISELKSELETYKKIAEKLAIRMALKSDDCFFCENYNGSKCEKYETKQQCIIEWARKEVEK